MFQQMLSVFKSRTPGFYMLIIFFKKSVLRINHVLEFTYPVTSLGRGIHWTLPLHLHTAGKMATTL